MPHKRYKRDQPERLINATNAVNATNVQPKYSIKQYKCCKRRKNVQPQCNMKKLQKL